MLLLKVPGVIDKPPETYAADLKYEKYYIEYLLHIYFVYSTRLATNCC